MACGEEVVVEEPAPVPCGPKSCTTVEYCCDAACGMCVEQGVVCTERCETPS
jgi:hypothetical protein